MFCSSLNFVVRQNSSLINFFTLNRHLSVTGPSPRTNFETPPLKEEREVVLKEEKAPVKVDVGPDDSKEIEGRPPLRLGWAAERTPGLTIENGTSSIRKGKKTIFFSVFDQDP